jgi:hypothetical protein
MKLKLVITALIGTSLWMAGCKKPNSGQQDATSIHIPEELFASQSFDPAKFLAGISIQPEEAILTSRELLHMSSFLQQTLAVAQANGMTPVTISKGTLLFKSLDASLRDTPGWLNISSKEEIDLAVLVEFIEKTQRG